MVIARHVIDAYVADDSHSLVERLAPLLVADCKCKCKSALLFNVSPSLAQLAHLDRTPWGPKLCAPTATVLGFTLAGAPVDVGSGLSAPGLTASQRTRTGEKARASVTRKRRLVHPLRQSLP